MKTTLGYVRGNSFFHKLTPLTKLFCAILLGVLCFMCQNLYFLGFIFVINFAIIIYSGIFKEGLSVFKLLLIIGALLFLFSLPAGGVKAGLVSALRTFDIMLPLSMMIMLTPVSLLSSELVGKLKVPYKYAFAATEILRFIPSLSAELEQIINVQTSRGAELDKGSIFVRLKKVVPLTVPLLVNAAKKTEQTAISLEIRGFGSKNRSCCRKISNGIGDIVSYSVIVILYITAIGINVIF